MSVTRLTRRTPPLASFCTVSLAWMCGTMAAWSHQATRRDRGSHRSYWSAPVGRTPGPPGISASGWTVLPRCSWNWFQKNIFLIIREHFLFRTIRLNVQERLSRFFIVTNNKHILLYDYIEMISLIIFFFKSFHLNTQHLITIEVKEEWQVHSLIKNGKTNSKLQNTIHFNCLLLICC